MPYIKLSIIKIKSLCLSFQAVRKFLRKKDCSFRVVAFMSYSDSESNKRINGADNGIWTHTPNGNGFWVRLVFRFQHIRILGSFKSCLAFGTPFGYFLPPSQEGNLQSLTIKLKTLNLGFSKPLCGLHIHLHFIINVVYVSGLRPL